MLLTIFSCAPAVLQGPLQSLTFLLNQGLLAALLGALWSMRVHWALSVLTGAFVRVAGMLAYVVVSSWVMNENLFSILMANIYSLLVRAVNCTLTPPDVLSCSRCMQQQNVAEFQERCC